MMLLGQSVGSEAGPQFKGLEHWGCSLAQEYRQLLTFIYCAHPITPLTQPVGSCTAPKSSYALLHSSAWVVLFHRLRSSSPVRVVLLYGLSPNRCCSLFLPQLLYSCSRICLPARADPGSNKQGQHSTQKGWKD